MGSASVWGSPAESPFVTKCKLMRGQPYIHFLIFVKQHRHEIGRLRLIEVPTMWLPPPFRFVELVSLLAIETIW